MLWRTATRLPVLSLPRKWNEFVAGCYLDDFSETHQKDVPVRARLTGIVPGAGVASCSAGARSKRR